MNRYAPPNASLEPAGVGGPPRGRLALKVLAVVFALYGLYCLYFALRGWNWSAGAHTVLSFVSAVGLWLRYRWSQYLVYLLTASIVGYFVWSVYAVIQMGWRYEDRIRSIAAIVPGALLLMLALSAAVYVFRVFRREPKPAGGP